MIFYKGLYSEIWVKLVSNETLGVLDFDYIEDYYGNDGQLTLRHLETDEAYPVLMQSLDSDTPSIDKDVFQGFHASASLPNGNYQIEGRVRDIAGNYTILSAFENIDGSERLIGFNFWLREGMGQAIDLGSVKIFGGYTFDIVEHKILDTINTSFKTIEEQKVEFISDLSIDTKTLDSYNIELRLEDNG